MSKRIFLLDGQIFQTGAWHRGMGKYMLQVMKQISEQADDEIELKLLFNDRIETDVARYEAIRYLSPKFEQLFISLPLPKDTQATPAGYKRALNHYVEHSFGASRVTYLITTLFSFDIFAEYPDNAGCKAIVFYDLIPLMNWKDLGGYFPPELYMSRFERMYESDIVYCISETTREDVLRTFSLDGAKVVNINGGYTEHHLKPVEPKNFAVPRRYVLFPTGNLPHKNNELAFEAMKKVIEQHDDVHLLVTSAFSDETKERLLKLCNKNVIFTQNVTDEELQYLYQHATIVLFASKYEGLGLPVLDAVFHNKPIVASSIPVFREMTDDAFFFFDLGDVESMSAAIHQALDPKKAEAKFRHYPTILAKYDWKNVGQAVLKYIDFSRAVTADATKKEGRVAIVSLNPGIEDSIGRLAERLYGQLRDVSVTYFFDSCGLRHKDMERPTFLDYLRADVYDLSRLTIGEYRKYDKVVYLIDDACMDFMIMEYATILPGAVVYASDCDRNDVIFVAAFGQNKNSFSLDRNNEQLGRVKEFILKPINANKKTKILKSWLPKRVKYEYLKREMSNE